MARGPSLTPEQVIAIRSDRRTHKVIAKEYDVTKLTILKVKNFQGTYKLKPEDLGTPILNAHGQIFGVEIMGKEEGKYYVDDPEVLAKVLSDAGE